MPNDDDTSIASRNSTFHVGIIGGGFAGLSLANCLQRAHITFELLESKDDNIPVVGTIQLPYGKELLQILDLWESVKENDKIFPRQAEGDFTTVSREDFLETLRLGVEGSFQYGCRVVNVVERIRKPKPPQRFVIAEDGREFGPFDVVVLADGLFGAKALGCNQSIDARIGDCRWYAERLVWWDFGTSRIQRGADIAIRDGVELGKRLERLQHSSDVAGKERRRLLGEFAMPSVERLSRQRRQRLLLVATVFTALLPIFYQVLQKFERI